MFFCINWICNIQKLCQFIIILQIRTRFSQALVVRIWFFSSCVKKRVNGENVRLGHKSENNPRILFFWFNRRFDVWNQLPIEWYCWLQEMRKNECCSFMCVMLHLNTTVFCAPIYFAVIGPSIKTIETKKR